MNLETFISKMQIFGLWVVLWPGLVLASIVAEPQPLGRSVSYNHVVFEYSMYWKAQHTNNSN